MLVKLVPEDFVVREQTRCEPGRKGPVALYELRKKKLGTFEAVRRIAARTGIPLNRISYAGLKDRQAVTTQQIAVSGGSRIADKLRLPGIKIRYLGRIPEPLSAADLLGNTFELVVRDLVQADVDPIADCLERVRRHGLINYFDDQRFGSLTAGQGLPGRDLVRGDHEAVVRALLSAPGHRDPVSEKRFKHLVRACWGDWDLIATKWGNRQGASIVRYLQRKPGDFAGALQRMPGKERAIHVFAYQSLIWNRSVALYLRRRVPAEQLVTTPYVGGQHVWLDTPVDAGPPSLVETFPLLDHTVRPEDEDVAAAVSAALAEEGLTVESFRIQGIKGCFFKHYERQLRVAPRDLVLRGPTRDERRSRGQHVRLKVELSFQLPPGAYATLVLKRLFGREPARGDRLREKKEKKEKKPKGKGRRQRKRGKAGAKRKQAKHSRRYKGKPGGDPSSARRHGARRRRAR